MTFLPLKRLLNVNPGIQLLEGHGGKIGKQLSPHTTTSVDWKRTTLTHKTHQIPRMRL